MSQIIQRFSFDRDAGKIYVRAGKVEIGQHIHGAFEKIVADAININGEHVQVAPVTTQSSPDDGMTVGSLSMQVTGAQLQAAAGRLRTTLFQEAAAKLQANIREISLNADTLEFSSMKQRCSIFDLTVANSSPLDPRLNKSAQTKAATIANSIRGQRTFIQDLVLPGMMHARALRNRRLGAAIPINVNVIENGGFSALLAQTETELELAWSGLQVKSDASASNTNCDGPVAGWIDKQAVLTHTSGETSPIDGIDSIESLPAETNKKTIHQKATRPFILHASIAPSCAIARFSQGKLEIWTHSQGIFPLRDTIAKHLNLPADDVLVHHLPSAGCYGHNAADDAAMDAVLVCLQTGGKPVRVIWTRQDDFQHAPVGTPMQVQIDAQLAEDNSISHWRQTIWSGPHGQRPGGAGNVNLLAAIEQNPKNKSTTVRDLPDALGGGANRNSTPPYAINSLGVTTHIVQDLPVRTSSLRGLGAHINVVCIETAIDQLAARCTTAPLEFRLRHLTDPRGREVLLQLQRELEAHPFTLQENEAVGIAYSRYKEKAAYAAVAVRIRLTENVELVEVRAVVDAGHIVDRSGTLNQIEGGIIQAASWTLIEGAVLRNGTIDAAGWDDYGIIGWSQIPAIHTHLLGEQSDLPYLGVGECMVGPVSAAIANAVSSVVGFSMTDLPLTREKFLQAATAV